MRVAFLACLAAAAVATPANALCFYGKKDFYSSKPRSYTTIPQEFRDSKWVVRGRIERERRHYSDADESWFVYDVRPVKSFKGGPTSRFRLFTFLDSGGFQPDVGIDYLLFLNPPMQDLPRGARGAVEINFSCGQSRPWREISVANRRLLARLATGRRR